MAARMSMKNQAKVRYFHHFFTGLPIYSHFPLTFPCYDSTNVGRCDRYIVMSSVRTAVCIYPEKFIGISSRFRQFVNTLEKP